MRNTEEVDYFVISAEVTYWATQGLPSLIVSVWNKMKCAG